MGENVDFGCKLYILYIKITKILNIVGSLYIKFGEHTAEFLPCKKS